jgi:hypothetical protein
MKRNSQRRNKHRVLGREISYFANKKEKKDQYDSANKFSENDIINMLVFLIDNIIAIFGERIFQQTVGIPIGTNCAPHLADLFLYSYEADLIQGLLKKNENKLIRSFNFTSRDILMMFFH